MGKVKMLPPSLSLLPSSVAFIAKDERERDRFRDQQTWRKWYRTARWKKLRWSVLMRDMLTCQRCGIGESDTSRLVANHKRPHRGDEALFWDADNLMTLCKPCHDGPTQADERRSGL